MLLDLARRARVALPHGSPLPEAAWRLRHRVILWVLALHAVGVLCFGVVQGFGVPHSLTEAAPLAVAAWLTGWERLSRRVRAGLATFGLLTPHAVYNHAEAWRSPLKWTGVHALFVADAGVAAVAN